MSLDDKNVPCRLCGTTAFVWAGTKLCDACWELERRIQANPKLAAQILAAVPSATQATPDAVMEPCVLAFNAYNDGRMDADECVCAMATALQIVMGKPKLALSQAFVDRVTSDPSDEPPVMGAGSPSSSEQPAMVEVLRRLDEQAAHNRKIQGANEDKGLNATADTYRIMANTLESCADMVRNALTASATKDSKRLDDPTWPHIT